MITYEKILEQVEANKTIDFVELTVENPKSYFKLKDIGYLEKFQLYANYFWFLTHNKVTSHYLKSLPLFFLKRQKPSIPQSFTEKEKFLRPVVNYLIKTHIRRQLTHIYRLYLREIITQNTLKNKEEIDELRKTNATVKEYIQELPNIKRFFLTLAGIIFGIISTAQILGVNSILFQIISAEFNLFVVLIIAIPILISFIISEIFVNAFRIKRSKLMNTTFSYPCYDLYFGKGKEIYEKSVYKIEDDLYEKLGKKNQKPKELPIDKILQLSTFGGFIVFLTTLIVVGAVISIISGQSLPVEIMYSLPRIYHWFFLNNNWWGNNISIN
jgi:hypothetical protein